MHGQVAISRCSFKKRNLHLIHIYIHDFSNISACFTNSLCSLDVSMMISYNKNPTISYHVYMYTKFHALIEKYVFVFVYKYMHMEPLKDIALGRD